MKTFPTICILKGNLKENNICLVADLDGYKWYQRQTGDVPARRLSSEEGWTRRCASKDPKRGGLGES